MVKEALEEAEKAQIAAEKAIKQADEDIQGTQNLLTSVRDSIPYRWGREQKLYQETPCIWVTWKLSQLNMKRLL